MITRSSCRAARLWLQAGYPAVGELPNDQRLRLDAHLASCHQCRGIAAQQSEMDALIRHALDLSAGRGSVRPTVLARLADVPAPSKWSRGVNQPDGARRHESILSRLSAPLHWRARATLPLIVATAILAIIASQYFASRNATAPVVNSYFHRQHIAVAFPLSVDPSRPRHLLAGAWGQVYETWNYGRRWHQLAQLPGGLVVRDVAVDPCQPNRYLVATKHSVYVSADAGRHWQAATSDLPGAMNMFIVPDPRRCGTMYLGPSRFWKSSDHGLSWSPAGRGQVFVPGGIQSLSVADNGDLITGIWAGGVAVSTNGGRSWQRRARGLSHDVMDVVSSGSGVLWAATDHGVFRSANNGLTWSRAQLPADYFVTSVVSRPGYTLIAGRGFVLRSTDGGKSWQPAMSGNLPLNPYVYSVIPDPTNRWRLYASLDGDGAYRSDDGGTHWRAINSGLPLAHSTNPYGLVLFRRGGALWATDTTGTDPGVLSVDEDVVRASLSPDNAAAAYVSGSATAWKLTVLTAPLPAVHTFTDTHVVFRGKGPLPLGMWWSPDSALLAVDAGKRVAVALVKGPHVKNGLRRFAQRLLDIGSGRVIGWSPDGRELLVWDPSAHRVYAIIPASRARSTVGIGRYAALPVLSRDGTRLALVSASRTYMGRAGRPLRAVATVPSGCRASGWSEAASRLLVTCGNRILQLSAGGKVVLDRRLPVNSGTSVTWAPKSDSDLVYFDRGELWLWDPVAGAHIVTARAEPVAS